MSDEPKIEPAMTPEEWAEVFANQYSPMPLNVDEEYDLCAFPHETAAICLYGQPFGFTRDEAILVEHVGHYGGNADWALTDEQLDTLLRIAAKISALLPPSGV